MRPSSAARLTLGSSFLVVIADHPGLIRPPLLFARRAELPAKRAGGMQASQHEAASPGPMHNAHDQSLVFPIGPAGQQPAQRGDPDYPGRTEGVEQPAGNLGVMICPSSSRGPLPTRSTTASRPTTLRNHAPGNTVLVA